MDIKELDKKQLILLTLLITFVVSIATGIVTVSLMNQMPKSVPQTINNVIQRTIEKVTTVQVPAPATKEKVTDNSATTSKEDPLLLLGNGDALVSIYLKNKDTTVTDPSLSTPTSIPTAIPPTNGTSENIGVVGSEPVAIGQGIIISDVGLILVDSSLIKENESYKVILDKTDFDVSVFKKYDNGFTVLKISPITPPAKASTDTTAKTQ